MGSKCGGRAEEAKVKLLEFQASQNAISSSSKGGEMALKELAKPCKDFLIVQYTTHGWTLQLYYPTYTIVP